MKYNNVLGIPAVFIWIGFVCAISFMEAWLKFRAPGVTLAIGLGIGRLVFHALNKIEWILALFIVFSLIMEHPIKITKSLVAFVVALSILILQTVWLLPILDYRAELQIQGSNPPPANTHFYYVGFEILKVISLVILGISFLQKYNRQTQ